MLKKILCHPDNDAFFPPIYKTKSNLIIQFLNKKISSSR